MAQLGSVWGSACLCDPQMEPLGSTLIFHERVSQSAVSGSLNQQGGVQWKNLGIVGTLPSAWGTGGGFSYMAYGDDYSAIGLHDCSLTGTLPITWASR